MVSNLLSFSVLVACLNECCKMCRKTVTVTTRDAFLAKANRKNDGVEGVEGPATKVSR